MSTNNTGTPFIQGLVTDLRKQIKTVDGAEYIPWATQRALAGNPHQTTVLAEGGGLVREVFSGGVVAVEQAGRILHLPIVDGNSAAIPFAKISSRDIGDALSRARARAVALINGVGLILYAKTPYAGNGAEYFKALGVQPKMGPPELVKVTPLLEEKGEAPKRVTKYLPWHASVAAATITDSAFGWTVIETQVVDQASGEIRHVPAIKAPGEGWVVGVTIHWRGVEHTEYLPIMGTRMVNTKKGPISMDNQPIVNPTATDWHRSVMRCVTKAVALVTGYGLSEYAKELPIAAASEAIAASASTDGEEDAGAGESSCNGGFGEARDEHAVIGIGATQTASAEAPKADTPAANPADTVKTLLDNVRGRIKTLGTTEGAVAKWLSVTDLDVATQTELESALAALGQRMTERGLAATH